MFKSKRKKQVAEKIRKISKIKRQDTRVALLSGGGVPRTGLTNQQQKCAKGIHKYVTVFGSSEKYECARCRQPMKLATSSKKYW